MHSNEALDCGYRFEAEERERKKKKKTGTGQADVAVEMQTSCNNLLLLFFLGINLT